MDPAVAAAVITIVPGAITATFVGLRRLKKIGHALNGQMDERFQRIEHGLGEVYDELREVKADVRDIKSDARSHRLEHEGDGR